ncbi:hypothetical protein [Ureibacillus sp. FSL E2-3493]|uniref:hypothetical protein n=1 Tax=Ureibacillus sp. FSL E2-3493 TaxID=2921367 RepID=UPI00311A5453
MSPTSIIIICGLIVILLIICLVTFFLKLSIRKQIWGASGILLILVIGYFVLLPKLVELQTNDAIEKLNTYLTTIYPNDSWSVTDTDDDKLKKTVELHVRFQTETDIVYSYNITDEKIEQIDFWSIEGKSSKDLINSGTKPLHLEKKIK